MVKFWLTNCLFSMVTGKWLCGYLSVLPPGSLSSPLISHIHQTPNRHKNNHQRCQQRVDSLRQNFISFLKNNFFYQNRFWKLPIHPSIHPPSRYFFWAQKKCFNSDLQFRLWKNWSVLQWRRRSCFDRHRRMSVQLFPSPPLGQTCFARSIKKRKRVLFFFDWAIDWWHIFVAFKKTAILACHWWLVTSFNKNRTSIILSLVNFLFLTGHIFLATSNFTHFGPSLGAPVML